MLRAIWDGWSSRWLTCTIQRSPNAESLKVSRKELVIVLKTPTTGSDMET